MNLSMLTHKELLNYAQPQTELEKKLFDACVFFMESAEQSEDEVNSLIRLMSDNEDAADSLACIRNLVNYFDTAEESEAAKELITEIKDYL